MPLSTYKDLETGNMVQAVEAGHGGTLFGIGIHFSEGDFIVNFPIDLQGEQQRAVFSPADFQKRFGDKRSKIDWKALGWG